MSIEQEVGGIAEANIRLEAQLLSGRARLQNLQRALDTGFLDTLKIVIEGGFLPEIVQRLGYDKAPVDKAGQLADAIMNPTVVEDVPVVEVAPEVGTT